MIAAVIPARAGSKRIPGKNIRPFAGRPMICHSIQAALDAGVFDAVFVSTDSEDIAQIARGCGAQAPFARPPELADDHTALAPVLLHALDQIEAGGQQVELLCLIYATAPLLEPAALRQGLEVMRSRQADAVFSVASFPAPVQRALTLDPEGQLRMLWPEHELTRSQDLPAAYHDAGQFHWLRTESFRQQGRLYMDRSFPVIIPRHRVQDIDTPEDWARAETLFAMLASTNGRPDRSRP
ncbi:MAG: pseudaminic acid cytidylyltransferase [Desulfovibrionales bacterium GWA2_65_9]|nr:MAG: pseudaminic acid cytidylyltransferase [Desulfovibrionales bacterium GWA2_65_9]